MLRRINIVWYRLFSGSYQPAQFFRQVAVSCKQDFSWRGARTREFFSGDAWRKRFRGLLNHSPPRRNRSQLTEWDDAEGNAGAAIHFVRPPEPYSHS